eukprot:8632010-Pyramimonas_sp.AAC.1
MGRVEEGSEMRDSLRGRARLYLKARATHWPTLLQGPKPHRAGIVKKNSCWALAQQLLFLTIPHQS